MRYGIHDETIYKQLIARGDRFEPDGRIISRWARKGRSDRICVFGYRAVAVLCGEKIRRSLAHRMIWRHFNGPIPEGMTINHKNGDRSDNRLENIELATMKDQAHHAFYILGRKMRRKLTFAMVHEIRQRMAAGHTVGSIARDFCVGIGTIENLWKNKIWKEVNWGRNRNLMLAERAISLAHKHASRPTKVEPVARIDRMTPVVHAIRRDMAAGMTKAEVAERNGVNAKTVDNIWSCGKWRRIPWERPKSEMQLERTTALMDRGILHRQNYDAMMAKLGCVD